MCERSNYLTRWIPTRRKYRFDETVQLHATVHRPTVEHLSPANVLLSVMQSTLYLRDQQQWIADNGYE